jgi:tetrahydromethanopterin S-methyltransferase subunit H
MPTLPNGAGGYQLGDGNLTEVNLTTSPVATAYTAAATLTAADLGGGLVVYTSSSAADLTLPTVAIVNATISSAKTNSAFDIALVATAAGVPTIVVGTGWTLVGSGAGVASKSVLFRAVKTSDTTYNLYRIAG